MLEREKKYSGTTVLITVLFLNCTWSQNRTVFPSIIQISVFILKQTFFYGFFCVQGAAESNQMPGRLWSEPLHHGERAREGVRQVAYLH